MNPVLSDVERNILLQIAAGRVPSEEVDHLPEVTEELRQALDNQGKILIKTWFEGNTVLISISDTGCGIPNEALPHIFNPSSLPRIREREPVLVLPSHTT